MHSGESLLFGSLREPNLDVGEQMTVAVATGSSWKHRKIESLRLLEGEFGRRRVSLDATPTGAVLEKDAGDRVLLVPLSMLVKQPLRDFDVTDDSGRAIPILGRSDDGFVAWSMLITRFSVDLGEDLGDRVLTVLHRIVHETDAVATQLAKDLIAGRIGEERVFDPAALEDETKFLTLDLASNFLLIAVLHGDFVRRQVIKYSSHWRVDPPDERQTWVQRLLVGLGFRGMRLNLAIGGASDAASYHLEVHALPGMLISRLKLPEGNGSPFRVDSEVGMVGHAVESYDSAPDSPTARLILNVPRGGDRTVALLTTIFTAAVFWFDRLLPNGHGALLQSADGAAALLLIIPAAFSLALSRPSENVVLSHLLFPLRLLTLASATLLLLGAASLVGHLHSGWSDALWWGGSVFAAISLALQAIAWKMSEARDTTW